MEFISLSDIGSKAFLMIVSILFLILGYGLIPLTFVLVATALVNLLIQFYGLQRLAPFRLSFHRAQAWWMLKSGIPFLTSTVFLVLYMQMDVLIIARLVNEQAVGWYAAASRLFGTFLFIPTVFTTVIFPTLSRMYRNSSESLPKVMSKSFDLLLMAGVPVGLGILAVANPMVNLLYGKDFANSGSILALMGIVLILTYQTMLLGYFCMSTDRQKAWSIVMIIATIATIPLDLILVPWCQNKFGNGAIGGSLSFIITESGMVLVGIILLPKRTLGWPNLWRGVRVLLAGLLMAISAWSLRNHFIVLPISVGALTYLVSIYVFRVIPPEDWILFRQISQSALIRLHLMKNPVVGLNERN